MQVSRVQGYEKMGGNKALHSRFFISTIAALYRVLAYKCLQVFHGPCLKNILNNIDKTEKQKEMG